MTRIAIITGSTRPGRRGEAVTRWVEQVAAQYPAAVSGEVTFETIDLAEVGLPLLDEAMPPILGQYQNPHTLRWAETIDGFDGFIFVTPEYNHSIPAVLKNAIDYLYAEWNDKAAGFVGYSPYGALRATEQLRLILGEVKVASVRDQVIIDTHNAAELLYGTGEWVPDAEMAEALTLVLDETITWAQALKTVRENKKLVAA